MSIMKSLLLVPIASLCLTGAAVPARAQGTTVPLEVRGSDAPADSDAVDLLIFQGEIYLEQGDLMNAAAAFTQVTAYAPDRVEGHLYLGRALTTALMQGQIKDTRGAAAEAMNQYRWVLDRDPSNTEALRGVELLSQQYFDGVALPLRTDAGREAWLAGQTALRKNDLEGAIREFTKAAGAEPKVGEVHQALADALRQAGRNRDALAEYEKALALNPRDARAHAGSGAVLEAQGDPDAALVHYRRAFSLDDDLELAYDGIVRILGARKPASLDGEDLSLLGRASLAAGRYPEAARLLETVAAADSSRRNLKALGVALFFTKDDAGATRILGDLAGRDPTDPEVLYYLAASLLRQNRVEEGRKYLEDALQLNEDDPSALRLLGLSLAEEPGEEEAAIALLRRADQLGAQVDDLPCILAPMEMRLNRADEARRDYEACLAEHPDDPRPLLGLGILADDAGRRGEAIMRLEQYLQKAEPDPAVLFRLGVAYLRVGRDDMGFSTLRRIPVDSTLTPSGSDSLSDTELLEMAGFFLSSLRRYDDAIFVGEMLLGRDPESAIYNNNLAMSYADADREPDRALELAEKANRLQPDDAGYLDTLGWTQVRVKKYAEAEKTFLRSLRLAHETKRTDLSEIYYHLGYLYRLMDRHTEATDYLTRALEDPPTPQLRAEIERLLELEKDGAAKP